MEPIRYVLRIVNLHNHKAEHTSTKCSRDFRNMLAAGRVIIRNQDYLSIGECFRILREPWLISAANIGSCDKSVLAQRLNVFLPSNTKNNRGFKHFRKPIENLSGIRGTFPDPSPPRRPAVQRSSGDRISKRTKGDGQTTIPLVCEQVEPVESASGHGVGRQCSAPALHQSHIRNRAGNPTTRYSATVIPVAAA